MNFRFRTLTIAACLLAGSALTTPVFAHPDHADTAEMEAPHEVPRIQIALLLDTSNSMDGLISQAKSQLWMLVNELGDTEKNGHKPRIELSLYEYGNSGLPMTEGYIRQVLPLTTDLDDVSEKLFALNTNGGQEYAGQVINTALEELDWSESSEDMKLIVIAGNEPFTQGQVSYETACAHAQRKGVIIDTVHCGDEQTGIATKWKAGADCGGGVYMTINQDEETIYIASPYDDEIRRLNEALNETYIGYGASGEEMKARQLEQDRNAASVNIKSFLSRTKSKASEQYSNESWDVVDGYAAEPSKIMALPDDALPAELQGKSDAEKAVYIENLSKDRTEIKAKISELEKKRAEFVAEERKTMAAQQTFDEIVVTGARAQAEAQGFK